jgi:hypothetical protein
MLLSLHAPLSLDLPLVYYKQTCYCPCVHTYPCCCPFPSRPRRAAAGLPCCCLHVTLTLAHMISLYISISVCRDPPSLPSLPSIYNIINRHMHTSARMHRVHAHVQTHEFEHSPTRPCTACSLPGICIQSPAVSITNHFCLDHLPCDAGLLSTNTFQFFRLLRSALCCESTASASLSATSLSSAFFAAYAHAHAHAHAHATTHRNARAWAHAHTHKCTCTFTRTCARIHARNTIMQFIQCYSTILLLPDPSRSTRVVCMFTCVHVCMCVCVCVCVCVCTCVACECA